MPFIQIPRKTRKYGIPTGGVRPFVEGNTGSELIVLEVSQTIKLELAAIPSAAAVHTVTHRPLNSLRDLAGLMIPLLSAGPDVLTVSPLQGAAPQKSFTITGLREGRGALLVDGLATVLVSVGKFQNHTDMEVDLIADVYRGNDPDEMHTLTRMFYNDENNLFNEQSAFNVGKWGSLACGTVSKATGSAIFYEGLDYGEQKHYYNTPIAGKNRASNTYKTDTLRKARDASRAILKKGWPVIVGLVYMPETAIVQGGRINTNATGGHTIPIVGCSADGKKFLYIDVYQEGSKLKYAGGHAGRELFPNDCDYLGMFELTHDPTRATDVLRAMPCTDGKSGVFSGTNYLEVVAGPM